MDNQSVRSDITGTDSKPKETSTDSQNLTVPQNQNIIQQQTNGQNNTQQLSQSQSHPHQSTVPQTQAIQYIPYPVPQKTIVIQQQTYPRQPTVQQIQSSGPKQYIFYAQQPHQRPRSDIVVINPPQVMANQNVIIHPMEKTWWEEHQKPMYEVARVIQIVFCALAFICIWIAIISYNINREKIVKMFAFFGIRLSIELFLGMVCLSMISSVCGLIGAAGQVMCCALTHAILSLPLVLTVVLIPYVILTWFTLYGILNEFGKSSTYFLVTPNTNATHV